MSARPLDLPATFARLWVDSSIHMLSATNDFWTGLMGAASNPTRTSTASPWWMPPQHSPLAALAQVSSWPAAFPTSTWGVPSSPGVMPLTGLGMPQANALFPWLPTAHTARPSNPFALWQQMWLQGAIPSAKAPWLVSETPAADALWKPVETAYRTANGHAMAAVLRTLADVVEPKPTAFNPAQYWPTTLGTRH
jgi:hypothetical protein